MEVIEGLSGANMTKARGCLLRPTLHHVSALAFLTSCDIYCLLMNMQVSFRHGKGVENFTIQNLHPNKYNIKNKYFATFYNMRQNSKNSKSHLSTIQFVQGWF